MKKTTKNPILNLNFYDLDVTAIFLQINRKKFVKEIMAFDYSKKDAKDMADKIITAISYQSISEATA